LKGIALVLRKGNMIWGVFLLLLTGVIPGYGSSRNPIRMGYLQADLHQLPGFIAIEKRLYEKQGLDVTVAGVFKAGPEEMSAFAANELDFGFVGVAPATVSVANHTAEVRVIGQVNNEGSAIVVRKDFPIQTLKDLKEKVVAIPGHATVQDVLLRKALLKEGLNVNDLKVMVLKPPEMLGAMRTKQIDAYIAWEPFVSMAVMEGFGKSLLTSREIWPGHPCCVLVVQKEFLSKNREAVKKILRAHVEAIQLIKDHREEMIGIAMKFTGVDKETVRRALGFIDFTYEPNVGGVIEYLRFLNELRYVRIEDGKRFVEGFVNGALLKEIHSR
jgi:NitT/TauT family transport system substrate-binding protein